VLRSQLTREMLLAPISRPKVETITRIDHYRSDSNGQLSGPILSVRIQRVVSFIQLSGSIIPCDPNHRYTVQTVDHPVRRYRRTRCKTRRIRRRRRGGPWSRACWCTSIGLTACEPAWAFAQTRPVCVTSWWPNTTTSRSAGDSSTRRRCRRSAVIRRACSAVAGKTRARGSPTAWAACTRTVCSPGPIK